jgi:hypothetical protein
MLIKVNSTRNLGIPFVGIFTNLEKTALNKGCVKKIGSNNNQRVAIVIWTPSLAATLDLPTASFDSGLIMSIPFSISFPRIKNTFIELEALTAP